MTFDPFGDFETRGYLRNVANEKSLGIVKRLEHAAFLTAIEDVFMELAKRRELGYSDVLQTHKMLFDAVYPWAGQDRTQTAARLTIKKGDVIFANPPEIRRAVEYGLHLGQNKEAMRTLPGEVMGYLAFGHPFLDGNGRTIMTVHSIMAQRAGFSIGWEKTDKFAYLDALTREIETPGKGILDNYLKSFVGEAIAYERLASHVAAVPGLDGSAETQPNEVLGESAEPAVKAQYEAMLHKRQR
jgi:cell filamentation protein